VKILRMAETEVPGDKLERARIAPLAAAPLDVQARLDIVVAAAHERVQWLERWHVSVRAPVQRPGTNRLDVVLPAIRLMDRRAAKLKGLVLR
jgi:hypothetical protein